MSHLDEGQLHALLDGELDAAERKAAETHLETCADCRRELAEARAFMAGADDLIAAVEVPADTGPAKIPLPGSRAFRWKTLAWAASLVCAVGLGWMARRPEVLLLDTPRPSENGATAMAPAVALPDSIELKRDVTVGQAPAPSRDEGVSAFRANEKSKELASQATGNLQSSPTAEAERALTNPADKDAPAGRMDSAPTASMSANGLMARKPEQPPTALPENTVTTRQQVADDSRRTLAPPAAPAAAAPAGAALEEGRRKRETAAFQPTPMEAAVRILGGSIRLVDGMTPTRVLVGAGNLVNGADPGLEVVRVVYNDPPGRELWLDQQRPQAVGSEQDALGKVATTLLPGDTLVVTLPAGQKGLRWIHQTGFRLGLTGYLPADSLRALARRVQ